MKRASSFHSFRVRCSVTLFVLLLMGFGCSSRPGDPPNDNGSPDVPDGFAIVDEIDPHVAILAQQLLEEGGAAALIAWAGATLLPEEYEGVMRATSGVLAGYMGNDLDRCRLVRELLSAAGIANRFALDGESCKVEAWIDEQVQQVSTSMFDSTPVPGNWVRATTISAELFHTVEILERHGDGTSYVVAAGQTETSLGIWTLAQLAGGPVIVDYAADSEGTRLRIRIGRRGSRQELFGSDVSAVDRHELVLRYGGTGSELIEHRRILFDRTSPLMNQSPDADDDVYAIWFGANVVGELYLQVESDLADLAAADAELGDVLYLRAAQLAMETDNAAWLVFENSELDGGAFFDSARIVIAAQERRYDDHDGVTPTFDLVRNIRRVLASSDPAAARFVLGYSDAMVEGALMDRLTGSPPVTVPDVFTGLYQEEAADVVGRAELFDDALRRLEEEGVTEESLVFSDEVSQAQVEVALVGTDLLLILDDDTTDRLAALAQDRFDELTSSVDGVVLGDGADRTWPIDLLLLDQGASLDYTPRIQHVESPQLALATPTGSYAQGSGDYLDEIFQFHAIVRAFEEPEVESDPDSKRDMCDWHLFDGSGALLSSGAKEDSTATLDESNPRVLQWGEGPSTVSYYESPLWVAPAVAAGIRAGTPTTFRIATDTGGAADWVSVSFTQFTDSRITLTLDGHPVGVHTIVATDDTQEYELTIAKNGLTRLVLQLRTPNGEARIDSITTPRALRLRGRVKSYRKPAGSTEPPTYSVGVPDAAVSSGGLIGTSWPDGTVDLRAPGTEQPTLLGGIGILIDTSGSMDQPADPDCTGTCTSKIEVVSQALGDIIQDAEEGIELAVWGFESTFDGSCDDAVRELAPWSLSRVATETARNSLTSAYLTGGTPLTGAVRGGLDAMDLNAWGISRRLIVLADGDNDCALGLSTVVMPDDIEVHTIGVGLVAGGDAELELMDLADRGGGTYTRTTSGEDLTDALTTIAALPLAPPLAEEIDTEISAEGHTPASFVFPVDQDDVVVYLGEAPDREIPQFVAVQPGEAFPRDSVELDANTMALIEEQRRARPEITVVMPDRPVSIGGWPDSFGWLEIVADTGETTAVTGDSLHGAGGAVYLGATVLGLWAGADQVIINFSECVLAPDGCGSDLGAIREKICKTSGAAPALAAISLSALSAIFTNINGFMLDESYATGLAVVGKLCSTEFDLTNFVVATAGSQSSSNLGSTFNNAVGFGYSLLMTIITNTDVPE